MKDDNKELIKIIPDWESWDEAGCWLEEGKSFAKRIPQALSETECASLEWSDIAQQPTNSFGMYSSENWRKFVLATFLADLVSFENPVDQVDFHRLAFVMHAFPQGFRTWWIKLQDHSWWPVGYSGWYPMLETTYQLFKNSPEKLQNRMVVPDAIPHEQPLLYLFNYSVTSTLRGSVLSKSLVKKFAEDVQKQKAKRLACITVSDDGVRIAKRFGMECRGYLTLEGMHEGVYTS